jgi:hypothetical protein
MVALLTTSNAYGATVTAASCSAADVQTALNSASAGDTIVIPPGTCRWTTPVTWNAPPNVILKGAGSQTVVGGGDATVIIDDLNRSGYDQGVLNIGTNSSGTFRMTGITFRGSGNAPALTYNGSVRIGGSGQQVRLDHLHIENLHYTGILVSGQIYGVIDHSLFDFSAGTALRFYASGWGGQSEGDGSWADATTLGSNRFVFVEDNVFNGAPNGGGVQDSYQGSRFVIRHNKIVNAGLQTHPTGGSGRARGTRAFEVYGNTATTTQNQFNFFFISSGTGVIWGNSVPTGYSNFVTLHSMRRNNMTYPQTSTPNGWGYCGTSFNGTGSNWDQNGTSLVCMDQPGRGIGDLLSGSFPNLVNRTTGCSAGSACAWPRQALEPIYEWANTWAPFDSGQFFNAYERDVLVANRDYYLHTPNFTGASGVGSGTLADRPGTCSAGVAYWATDTNTLYKCTATNTWSTHYKPYAYPHPLVSGSTAGGPDTTAPTPGSSGMLASNVVGNNAALTWTKATDDTSLQSTLLYEVRLSTNNDIDTVTKAEGYGALVVPYTPDINTAVIPGLTAGTTYFFNVIVKDEAGNKSIYIPTSATAPAVDTLAPVPGNSGAITSSATTSSVNLGWVRAMDNMSPQSLLEYEVRRSSANNLGSVANAEANGVIVRPYSTDLPSATVGGLSPNTAYYFNVIVRDTVGNKAVYFTKNVLTAPAPDETAPIPGNGGAITSSSVSSNGVTLSFGKATDETSAQTQLAYEIRRSSSDNIDTVLRAEAYGTIVQGYTLNIAAANITGLSPRTTYYFNVIVKDAAGNRAAYLTKSVTTAEFMDTSAPIPGNSGLIASSGVGPAGLTVNWAKATDNSTAQNQLVYEVRRSLANNIDTVARAETNGIVVLDDTTDVGSAAMTGLTSNTTYFFNVIVRDISGNKSVYQTAAVTTTGDTTAPMPGNSGQMTSNANSSSITVSFTKATDNLSPQSALRYEGRISTSNNLGTVAKAELNGTIVKPYAADISTFEAVGLSSGTEYYLTVIVKDEANNKAVYATRMDVTTGRKMTQLNQNGRALGRRDDEPLPPPPAADTTAPIPGGSGLVAISGISQSGLTLRWTTGTDDISPKTLLQYQVVESSSKNINTVAQAETNGNVLLAYSPDINSFVVRGLSNAVQHFFTVIVKDEAGNKAVYATAGNLGEFYTYLTNGGVSFATVSARTSPLSVSQLQVTPGNGTVAPAGLAIVRSTGSRGVMSTAGLPLSGGIRAGSIYADMTPASDTAEAVKTGIALANASTQDAEISFFFTDPNGVEIRSGVYTLLANHQISGFLDESPFNGPGAFKGTFSFSSSAPISAIGTRSLTQRSGEFLLQSLPIAMGSPQGTSALIPTFVDGGGWSTEVVLTNPTSALQVGKVEFWGHGSPGVAATAVQMTINGVTASTFSYSIPPRSVVRMVTAGTTPEVNSGSVRVTTTGALASGGVPNAVAIISSRRDGTTISQTSLDALPAGSAFRSYVETASSPDWVSSSLAIVNSSDNPNTLNLALMKLDGTPVTSTSVTLPPNGQIAQLLTDIFPSVAGGFRGLLRVTASAPIGFATFRSTTNASGDFLFASTPSQNEAASLPSAGLAFPLVASGAGYDTQVILFGQSGQSGTGEMMFISKDGVPQTASSLGVAP